MLALAAFFFLLYLSNPFVYIHLLFTVLLCWLINLIWFDLIAWHLKGGTDFVCSERTSNNNLWNLKETIFKTSGPSFDYRIIRFLINFISTKARFNTNLIEFTGRSNLFQCPFESSLPLWYQLWLAEIRRLSKFFLKWVTPLTPPLAMENSLSYIIIVFFIAYGYSNSVRPSVRGVPVFYRNDLTCGHIVSSPCTR